MSQADPKRGDIWYVEFNPTQGHEIKKRRPAVVISSDALGVLPLKLVVPITGWSASYERKVWIVRINPSVRNGLTKPSAAEAFQTRSVSLTRFRHRIGMLEHDLTEQVVAALALVVEVD